MASSDDEMEDVPESVTNYYFEDDNKDPISFAVLPIDWNTSETLQVSDKRIYVRGNADGGMDKIYKPVKAWKFDISGVKPEISVLCKDNNWIKLQKPRQSYEEFIRTVLITVNFLRLVKKNPESPWKRIWKKLASIFSLYDDIPSSKDLRSHKALIEKAVKQDESLKQSKCLMTFLERNPQKKHKIDEDVLVKGKSEFVVSDDDCSSGDLEDDSGDEEDSSDAEQDGSADEEDDEEDAFDSVCSICDEGGTLLCCEGSCMRSFHATVRAGIQSKCSSLGFTEKEVQTMPSFKCQNCQKKLHQCFSCGKLGSSDKQTGAKVFQCVNATCGYFYHPFCVANRLHGSNEDAAKELAEKIRAGESFTCPLHICVVCKQAEDKTVRELQMGVCRRCPKAYHRKCLPKRIAFEEDEDAGIEQRAWEGLLVDRILIYCLKHEILDDLGTPARDHIKFSRDVKKDKEPSAGVLTENKVASEKKMLALRVPSQASPALESKKKAVEASDPDKKNDRRVPVLQSNKLKKLPSEKMSVLTKNDGSSGNEELNCIEPYDMVKPSQTEKLGEVESTKTSKTTVKELVPQLDSDSERRILNLMNEASSIITLDDVIGKHEKLIPSRSYKQKMDPCKSITLGKVEKFCEGIREAVKKLDGGSSIENAKTICPPRVLNQMDNWKGKLRVYLAPFLHGSRYTSFGRHFTKPEKLKEIVDTMHWYVNDDDTIVDFCCGANVFSWLMKQKLESRGKKCNYKNYDLFRPKNDFCFEQRDWMGVQPSELPTGSKLIMGLNPPFGVKAALANKFINKALMFKPKLLILIVPVETERLDKKQSPYDLVWENKDQLSGKSFYLPGSVDLNDKQLEDWNVVPPGLYLWSRPDWTARHMEIAKKYKHLLGEQRETKPNIKLGRDLSFKNQGQSSLKTEVNSVKTEVNPIKREVNSTKTEVEDPVPQTPPPEVLKEAALGANEELEKQSTRKDRSIEKHVNAAADKSRTKRGSRKKRHSEEMHVGRAVESSQDFKRRRSLEKPYREVPYHSPQHTRDGREPWNSMYQGPPLGVNVRDPVHDYPGAATSYGTGHYGNFHNYGMAVNYHPQEDIHLSRRERGPEVAGPPDYNLRNPIKSNLGDMRPDLHGYGINRHSGTVVPGAPETSGYSSRVNNMSAMEKYNIRLDAPNHVRMGVGAGGYPDLGYPAGANYYNHHQSPRPPYYPGVPMGFSPGPPRPYHHHHTSSGGWLDE